jgi:hypothetical protein
MDDSISAFVKSVSIASCRVINTPHLVFLCGGATSDTTDGPFLSARDYFHRYIRDHEPELGKRVRLAERINDWFDEDTFADLLELEVHLADVSDLTILFVESAGSIAELGAFATEDLLRPKTLAVLNSAYPSVRTFIADGPVRRIKKHDVNLIRYFEWKVEPLNEQSNLDVFEDMSQVLVQFVLDRGAAAPKEQLLNKSSIGHTMFLIADLVDLVGITTGTEITECL